MVALAAGSGADGVLGKGRRGGQLRAEHGRQHDTEEGPDTHVAAMVQRTRSVDEERGLDGRRRTEGREGQAT